MATLRGTWLCRAPILLPLLLSTACASIPNLGAKPEMRSASEFAATASLTPSGAAWPDRGWWLRYNDPQLNRLIDEGIAGSPDMEAAAARFRTAQGIAQQAGGALSPSIDAFGTSDFAKIGDSKLISQGKAGLSFSFDLDLWGKNRAALAAATSDAEAAGYELAEARLALTTGIASTYADLAQLYRQRDTLDSALQIRSESLKLVNQRVEIGLDTRAELKQAEGRVAEARGGSFCQSCEQDSRAGGGVFPRVRPSRLRAAAGRSTGIVDTAQADVGRGVQERPAAEGHSRR